MPFEVFVFVFVLFEFLLTAGISRGALDQARRRLHAVLDGHPIEESFTD